MLLHLKSFANALRVKSEPRGISARGTRALVFSCLALALTTLGGARALAFQNSAAGRINGVVRSSAGVAISGARITLTNERTSESRSAVTSKEGNYEFATISEGIYTLKVESEGFAPSFRKDIAINADQTRSVDISLANASPADPASTPAGYYDDSSLKPSTVHGSVDAGGYSTPGQARATDSLIHGVAGMKNNPGGSAHAPAPEAMDPKIAAMEVDLKKAVQRSPRSYEANHELGEFYLHVGKLAAGVPYMEKAESLDPTHYDNGYDLALACLETGNLAKAREQLTRMIARQDNAELHDLLGEVEEAAGNYVPAVNEYERAAHMDPSEGNIFDWGSELLLHQTLDPAIEVFTRGVERYPRSAMLLIGQGVALYSRGRYDDAVKALCAASDITPADPRPYLFLGKMYNVSTVNTEAVTSRLERFVKLDPKNALAHFDYAMSVWKGQRGLGGQVNFDQIESLLKSALAVDPQYPDAHFEMGNLYSEQKQYPQAIAEYQQALAVQPEMVDAHYRLAQAYTRTGDKAKAQQEFELHDRLRKQQLAETEKQRAEIKQFVYSVKGEGKQ
jgi:tetratricopeptide (TPR) repeat protein